MPKRAYKKAFEAISQDRLLPYCITRGDQPDVVLQRYIWNIKLCEALYPALHNLEVSLRNTIHSACTQAFQTEYWFEKMVAHIRSWVANQKSKSNQSPLAIAQRDQADRIATRMEDQIIGAKKRLAQIKKYQVLAIPAGTHSEKIEQLTKNGKTITAIIPAGAIVAELNFGFWTAIFDDALEHAVWRSVLIAKKAFPDTPKDTCKRAIIGARINGLRNLRNRVFHHEPIWHWQDITKKHDELIEAIGWLNPAIRELTTVLDRFPRTTSEGPQAWQPRINAFTKNYLTLCCQSPTASASSTPSGASSTVPTVKIPTNL